MSLKDQWRRGYAIQAQADLQTREFLRHPAASRIPDCHRLQFLQMACEKLVKAHLFTGNVLPANLLTSHAVIAKHLPGLVNEHYRRQKGRSMPRHLFGQVRALSRQIELLAPAVDDAGRQPANCEYPWLDRGKNQVFVPAEYQFGNLDLPRQPAGRLILKVLPLAIAALVQAS